MENFISVGFIGELVRGKTTIINALLGQELLPSDIIPSTAVPTYVRGGKETYAELYSHDGSIRRIGTQELEDYITMFTPQSTENAKNLEKAVVYCQGEFFKNPFSVPVQLVDIPGFNYSEEMDRIAESMFPKLDIAVMVIQWDNPLSISEFELFYRLLYHIPLHHIIFVVSKIDTVREAEKFMPRTIEGIKYKIQKYTERKFGEDSESAWEVRKKLENVPFVPVSALDMLDGIAENNPELCEKSNFSQLERALYEAIEKNYQQP